MDKFVLLSLSGDLKRICTSIQRNSLENAETFQKEAKKWLKQSKEIEDKYIRDLFKKVEKTLNSPNDLKKAEYCLLYSVLLQNQALANTPS